MDAQINRMDENAEKRARIEAALKADPNRSDRLIAAETQTSQPTTYRVRRELEAAGLIPFIEAEKRERRSPRSRRGEYKAIINKLKDSVSTALVENPKLNNETIAQKVGTSRDTVSRVRKALEELGKIPSVRGSKRVNEYGLGVNISGQRIIVPEGMSLSEYIQTGIQMQRDGMGVVPVARKLKLDQTTYVRGSRMVLLSEIDTLSKKEKEKVEKAVFNMNATRLVSPFWREIKDIADREFGTRRSGRLTSEGILIKRRETFKHAIGLISDTCSQATDVEIPPLKDEEKESHVRTLTSAMNSLAVLRRNIRRGNNG